MIDGFYILFYLQRVESWYSVTPEKVAQHIASRCKASDVVIDGFYILFYFQRVESWYSVTPEKVAQHIASRCKASDVVIDGFCGCGGNTIQFAAVCQKVISIDIDPAKLRLAQHNASVYGVSHKIQFIQGDFFALAPSLQGDVVFLSPPWGGPEYARSSFSIDNIFPEQGGGRRLFQVARGISPNVGYYLPRTSDVFELIPLAGEGNVCEVEQNFVGRKFVAITAYYGNLVRRKDRAS
ncbi:trimethylguanosine synthase-like [Diaphorina citri]|uniref:Trimethylguanosine synthase n=1 Tax=Diaphorina citri TaxID=121845 RepID=A0A1S3DIX0_DIACI|nr:trimethylguanosine synthase-like [Diaphorina citri]